MFGHIIDEIEDSIKMKLINLFMPLLEEQFNL